MWCDTDDTVPPCLRVLTRVETPVTVPRPGTSASATWLRCVCPVSLVQPNAVNPVVEESTGTWSPSTRVPKPRAFIANGVEEMVTVRSAVVAERALATEPVAGPVAVRPAASAGRSRRAVVRRTMLLAF